MSVVVNLPDWMTAGNPPVPVEKPVPPPALAPKPRPIKIDPADGPCEICAAWAAARAGGPCCDGCGARVESGYESQTIHHYHLGQIGSAVSWLPIHRELCVACYREDFAAKYPGVPLPV